MVFKEGKIKIERIFEQIVSLREENRIIEISEFFINVPYKKNSLVGNIKDREILVVDFEGVDCMTLIEYVEALRLSYDFESFICNLRAIRYLDCTVEYTKRRHFFSDWDSLKTVKNITAELGDTFCNSSFKELNKIDEKKRWINELPIKLKKIIYIPKENILKILSQLDSVYYCGFYTKKQGLDVTHVGIVFREKGSLILRHASSIRGKVIDEPFEHYALSKDGLIIYKPIFS